MSFFSDREMLIKEGFLSSPSTPAEVDKLNATVEIDCLVEQAGGEKSEGATVTEVEAVSEGATVTEVEAVSEEEIGGVV